MHFFVLNEVILLLNINLFSNSKLLKINLLKKNLPIKLFFEYFGRFGNLAEINLKIILHIYLMFLGIKFIFPINSKRKKPIVR